MESTEELNTQDFTIISEISSKPLNRWALLTQQTTHGLLIEHELAKDCVTVGRNETCDIVLKENDIIEASLYKNVSNVHFSIEKYEKYCVLTDKSSNGTVVNGNMIGKENKIIVSQGDVIGLFSQNVTLFTFTYTTEIYEDVDKAITCNYILSETLGKGAFGTVKKIIRKDTLKEYALKINCTNGLQEDKHLKSELNILYSIDHGNLVRMHEAIVSADRVYFIMELLEGGDLEKLIRAWKKLSEKRTKHIFYQLIEGVVYLHSRKIVHRDIKPANVLLASKDDYPVVKLSDFGLSKMTNESVMTSMTLCGTPFYNAPEMHEAAGCLMFSNKIDMWSLGVLLYKCLSGKFPFNGKQAGFSLLEEKQRGKFTMEGKMWNCVTNKARDLISKLIVAKPSNRLSAQSVKDHPWLAKDLEVRKRIRTLSLCDSSVSDDDSHDENSQQLFGKMARVAQGTARVN